MCPNFLVRSLNNPPEAIHRGQRFRGTVSQQLEDFPTPTPRAAIGRCCAHTPRPAFLGPTSRASVPPPTNPHQDDSAQPPLPPGLPPVPRSILSRSRSPLERCFSSKCLVMREDTVPLPEPGAPMIAARTSRADAPMAAERGRGRADSGASAWLRAHPLRRPGPAGWQRCRKATASAPRRSRK